MNKPALQKAARYKVVTEEKAGGATYTPKVLADFVADQILEAATLPSGSATIRVFDPAVGEGELLASLLERLPTSSSVSVHGFETNVAALKHAKARIQADFPQASIHLEQGDFLRFVLDTHGVSPNRSLFDSTNPEFFDLVIANPPYVRTQIMGASQAQSLTRQFGLNGRVDLYHAFILGMAQVLAPDGVAGIILSNRFMTTKAGASVRQAILKRFSLQHVWDLGDTKLFEAAVLPAIMLAKGTASKTAASVAFTSIYETPDPADHAVSTPIEALSKDGVAQVAGGRLFRVRRGVLDHGDDIAGVWRVSTRGGDAWLATVEAHTWQRFRDVGKVRVGVKTCADRVFIQKEWNSIPQAQRPELVQPLTTHHISRRFKAENSEKQRHILYPHESVSGKRRTMPLDKYPRSKAYLEEHRETLEGRKYVIDAGRQWYEIWVPQDPADWPKPKLVFRDIAEEPCFWIDLDGSIVNGDCYWLACDQEKDQDLLWLAVAVGNSTFIEAFYDHRFNNKLYAGRRRFITQYVEQFPLPDPSTKLGKTIIKKSRTAYDAAGTEAGIRVEEELNALVWKAFGLSVEEVAR